MSDEDERAYREALAAALYTGWEILSAGGDALDAVEATVRSMEDSSRVGCGVRLRAAMGPSSPGYVRVPAEVA